MGIRSWILGPKYQEEELCAAIGKVQLLAEDYKRQVRSIQGMMPSELNARLTEADVDNGRQDMDIDTLQNQVLELRQRVTDMEQKGDSVTVDSLARRVIVLQDKLDQLWGRVYRSHSAKYGVGLSKTLYAMEAQAKANNESTKKLDEAERS